MTSIWLNFGLYQQDDRDVRNGRRKHKLDKAYSSLCRIKLRWREYEQWLVMDELAITVPSIRSSSPRAKPPLHGILKSNLKRHRVRG